MIPSLRQTIYATAKHDTDLINSCKAGISMQEGTVEYWQAVLRNVEQAVKPRKRAKRKVEVPQWVLDRYREAYHKYQAAKFPSWVKDGHTLEPRAVDTGTSNGLQEFILNYCNWKGHRATRINVMGRQIKDKWIPSATKKGSADLSLTLNGRSVMLEIKIGADKPSEHQLKEQIRERKAGGIYEFIKTAEDFFRVYDSIVVKELF